MMVDLRATASATLRLPAQARHEFRPPYVN